MKKYYNQPIVETTNLFMGGKALCTSDSGTLPVSSTPISGGGD